VQTNQPQTVLVILTGAAAPAGLARAAIRNSWPILQGPLNRVQLDQSLTRDCSSVVLVHVPALQDQGLELIHGLRSSWRSTVVIAIGDASTEESEVRARVAGASLFLPGTSEADVIERTVLALMGQDPHVSRTPSSVARHGPRERRHLVS
jgi:hypothetical protein